jgi:hypothetical protein
VRGWSSSLAEGWGGVHQPGRRDVTRVEGVTQVTGEPGSARTILDGEESCAQQALDLRHGGRDLMAVSSTQEHLSVDQWNLSGQALTRHGVLSSGTLGEWPDAEVSAKSKPGSKPRHRQCSPCLRSPQCAFRGSLVRDRGDGVIVNRQAACSLNCRVFLSSGGASWTHLFHCRQRTHSCFKSFKPEKSAPDR